MMPIRNIQLLTGRTFTGKIVSPVVTDDSAAGYLIGDFWVDETNKKSYQLFVATVGAAEWNELTGTVTAEQIEDFVGAMVSGNTETGIAVTYDDPNGKLNFDAQTAGDARYAPIAKGVTNGDTHDHVGGDGAAIVEAAITLADNTTNDVTSTKHGLAPKSPADATKFLNGAATPAWTVPIAIATFDLYGHLNTY